MNQLMNSYSVGPLDLSGLALPVLLAVLLASSIFAAYLLFFVLPTRRGKQNQRFVKKEVKTFSNYYKDLLADEYDKISEREVAIFREVSDHLLTGYRNLIADESEKARAAIKLSLEDTKNVIEALLVEAKDQILTQNSEIGQAMKASTDSSLNATREDITQQHSQLSDLLSEQYSEFQRLFTQKLEESSKKLDAEVAVYREARMQKVDESIDALVRKVLEDVLGKKLDTEDHLELIRASLEEAKKDGVLGS